jgi:hypothetical protein
MFPYPIDYLMIHDSARNDRYRVNEASNTDDKEMLR